MGTTVLLKFALIGWCATSIQAVFTQGEMETIVSSLKLHKIGNCILALETNEGTVKRVIKKLNENFVSTGFMRINVLEDFVKNAKPPDSPTAIAVKVKTTSKVKRLFVQNSRRLHWFVWFLVAEDELHPEIKIPFNCQLFQIQNGDRGSLRLIEKYHVRNTTTYVKDFGVWTSEEGLNASSMSMYRRREDLEGARFEVMVCNLNYIKLMEDKLKQFWMDFERILNFTLKMEPPQTYDMTAGYITQTADATTCIYGITGLDFDRDWIFSSSGEKLKIAMKYRGTHEIGWRAYVQPFTKEMWVAVGVWLFLSSFAIVIVSGCNRGALYTNAFTAFYCLCNSDPMTVHPPNKPLPLSIKIAYFMTLAVAGIIVPAYSAYILSTLSIVLPVEPFNDIQGFIADGTYRLTTVQDTFAFRYLKGSNDPDMKYVYMNLFVGDGNIPVTFFEFFRQLCKNNKLAGLFPDRNVFRVLSPCPLFIARQEVLTVSTGILLPKGSPFRKILNEKFAEYFERVARPPILTNSYEYEEIFRKEADLNSLNMSQMVIIFLIVPLGVVLSLIVLALEMAVKRMSNRNGFNVYGSFYP